MGKGTARRPGPSAPSLRLASSRPLPPRRAPCPGQESGTGRARVCYPARGRFREWLETHPADGLGKNRARIQWQVVRRGPVCMRGNYGATEVATMELTRREALKLGMLGSAALLLPLEKGARTASSIRNRLRPSELPKPFQVPLTIPSVVKPARSDATTDYYEIKMRMVRRQVLPKPFGTTLIYGYNGVTPGPTIEQRVGRKAVVRQINLLPDRHPTLGYPNTTSVHLHGSDSAPEYDGWDNDVIRPGQYKDYHYPDDQDARPLWYHDHAVHHTSENAYMGCAAFYFTRDALEDSLPIPSGTRYEVPLMIQDKIFSKNGDFVFDDEGHSGLFGDVILVNGSPWPTLKVERRKYRFRILNASTSRSYDLALSSGEAMHVIGHDGGLAPQSKAFGHLRIGMAERYGVIVDFAK